MVTSTLPSPFVGAHPFEESERSRFFGRERVLRDLLHLVIAERVVLLYSPSGAGKTSLLQAGLAPALRDEGFRVLPIMRVNREAEREQGEGGTANRFIMSALECLHEGIPADRQKGLDPTEIGEITFREYLDRIGQGDAKAVNEVLVFDQFEEILKVDPSSRVAHQARLEFFRQVADALSSRRRWAVFSLREDYLAGLDPYRRPIPTRLANHFRLDLLGVEDARRAISLPPQLEDVTFAEDAVERLLDDLKGSGFPDHNPRVDQVQLDDALYIEPLQLQVVCERLWRDVNPRPHQTITVEQVGTYGDVNDALRDFYDGEVSRIASEQAGGDERSIRDWFEYELIIGEEGIRGQVARGETRSGGVSNGIADALVNAKLVNQETRLKSDWYELAHDRLIDPVHASNTTWYRRNLNTYQRNAQQWARSGQPASSLLGLRAWWRARRWVRSSGVRLRDYEKQYLDQSGAALTRRYLFPIGLLVLPVILLLGMVIRPDDVTDDERLANATGNWALTARQWLPLDQEEQLDLGLLLSAEAVGQLEAEGLPISFTATDSLFDGMVVQPYFAASLSVGSTPESGTTSQPGIRSPDASQPITMTGDGRLFAAADASGHISFETLPALTFGPRVAGPGLLYPGLDREGTGVTAMTFLHGDLADTSLLAVGTSRGSVEIWAVQGNSTPTCLGSFVLEEAGSGCGSDAAINSNMCGSVTTIALGSKGQLAAGCSSGVVGVWELSYSGVPLKYLQTLSISTPGSACEPGTSGCARVVKVAFSQTGVVVASYSDRTFWTWSLRAGDTLGSELNGLPSSVELDTLALSPDGEFLAIEIQGGFYLRRLHEHDGLSLMATRTPTEPVSDLVFNPADPTALYSGHENGEITRWGVNGPDRPFVERLATVSGAEGARISDLAFSPEGRWLASRDGDGSIRLWNPLGLPPIGQAANGLLLSRPMCVEELRFDDDRLRSEATGESVVYWEIGRLPSTPQPAASPSGTAGTPAPATGFVPMGPILSASPAAFPDTSFASPAAQSTTGSRSAAAVPRSSGVSMCQNHRAIGARLRFEDIGFAPTGDITGGVVGNQEDVLITTHSNGDVKVWEKRGDEWAELGVLPDAGDAGITSVARNARRGEHPRNIVAAGRDDGTITIWLEDEGEWKLLGQLPGHSGPVYAMTFHSSQDYLASGDTTGLVVLWTLEPADWQIPACDRAGRGRVFTEDELHDYLDDRPDDWTSICPAAIN